MIRIERPLAPRPGLMMFGSFVLLFALGLPTQHALGQDFSFTTVTTGEFGGSLGTMMKLVPGAMDPIREATYLKGALIRTDDTDGYTVMDGAEARITQVNDETKTFFSFTIQEMQARMTAAMAEAGEAQATAEREAEQPEEAEVSFDIKLSTDRTGRTQDFGEYSAEQVLMIIETVPRTDEARDAVEEGGSMVLFTELWLSKDFPAYEQYMAAQAELGEAFVESGGGSDMASAYQQAFASDPRMQDAFEENLEAMKDLDGMQVKSVSSFVTVPAGMPLDRDAVLAATDQTLSESVGSAVGNAAAKEAEEAARGAVRGLTRGLLGRGKKEEPKEEPAPAQFILMRITSLLDGFSTDPLSDDLFTNPPEYTEEVPEWLRGGGI